jgi:biotin carboxyl carrier protein
MHYVALLNGEEREVEVTELSAGRYQLSMNGRTVLLDARHISDTTLSLLFGNDAYHIESEASPDGRGDNVLVRGHLLNVEVLDLRALRLRRVQDVVALQDGPVEVRSPMPGKVIEILVQEGQSVDEGQGLMVVEAMKMENELRSPRKGVIKNLRAIKGEAVEGGVSLCVVE